MKRVSVSLLRETSGLSRVRARTPIVIERTSFTRIHSYAPSVRVH